MVNTRVLRASEGPPWPLARHWTAGIAVLLGVVLTLSACAPGASPPQGLRATATPLAVTPTTTPASQLTMKQAWGDVTVTSLPTSMGDNLMFNWNVSATPDKQWLLGTVSQYLINQPQTQPEQLVLYNIHTRQVQRIRTEPILKSAVLGASVDDHWVAWSEADDPRLFDWTLFLYNRGTGQTTKVAAAPKVNGQPVSGPNTPPVLSGGHMIWSESLGPVTPGDTASLQNAVVKLEDLSTGSVTTLATGAGQSTLSWPWAAWQESSAAGSVVTRVKNLETGQQAQITQKLATLALHGPSVAYDDLKTGYLIGDITKYNGNPQQVASSDDVEEITLNDRLVAARQDVNQPIVWDRLFNRPVELPMQNPVNVASAWVSGDLLVWWQSQNVEQQIPPVLQIVDTSTLPTTPVSPA